jgi:hypothetical protein
MFLPDDPDAELRRRADDPDYRHRDTARHAIRFRATGDVAHLLAVLDDPHPCVMVEILFAVAGANKPWLNRVPMPTEAICAMANEFGGRKARGERVMLVANALTAAEPASAVAAAQQILGPFILEMNTFPDPDLRKHLRPTRYRVWQYQGSVAIAAVPAPSSRAVELIQTIAHDTWPSPIAGYNYAAQLGELPLQDLLGLLAHAPTAPDTPRWNHLAKSTPTYWYRLMPPWVCLGILHHANDEPWATSTRRQVLVDLAFGVEDWVSDSALFALVTAAYRQPEVREEVRALVRARLDAAVAATRLVTIEKSLAQLILVTPRLHRRGSQTRDGSPRQGQRTGQEASMVAPTNVAAQRRQRVPAPTALAPSSSSIRLSQSYLGPVVAAASDGRPHPTRSDRVRIGTLNGTVSPPRAPA